MGVTRRKCFYEVVNGTIRPHEWALVTVSGFGAMVEPYWPFECNSTAAQGTLQNDDFSTNNEFQRVDEFRQVDDAALLMALSGGEEETWLTGGRNYPRTGK